MSELLRSRRPPETVTWCVCARAVLSREWFICASAHGADCEPDEDFSAYYGQPIYVCEM